MVIRKTVIDGVFFNENISRCEDLDFAVKLYISSKAVFAFKNMITGIYYRHQKSLTHSSDKNDLLMALDAIYLYSIYLSFHRLESEIKRKLKKRYCIDTCLFLIIIEKTTIIETH